MSYSVLRTSVVVALLSCTGVLTAQDAPPAAGPAMDDMSRMTYVQLDQCLTDISDEMSDSKAAADRIRAGEAVLDFIREVSRRALAPEKHKTGPQYLRTLNSSWRFQNTLNQLPPEYQERVAEFLSMMKQAVPVATTSATTPLPPTDGAAPEPLPPPAIHPPQPRVGLLTFPGMATAASGAVGHQPIRYDVFPYNPGRALPVFGQPSPPRQTRKSVEAGLYGDRSRRGRVRVWGSSGSSNEYGARRYGASPVGSRTGYYSPSGYGRPSGVGVPNRPTRRISPSGMSYQTAPSTPRAWGGGNRPGATPVGLGNPVRGARR